jgi:hypothetical protein
MICAGRREVRDVTDSNMTRPFTAGRVTALNAANKTRSQTRAPRETKRRPEERESILNVQNTAHTYRTRERTRRGRGRATRPSCPRVKRCVNTAPVQTGERLLAFYARHFAPLSVQEASDASTPNTNATALPKRARHCLPSAMNVSVHYNAIRLNYTCF